MTDTTRRKFFGLLATAPIAVPAIAKEVTAAMTPPKDRFGHLRFAAGESLNLDRYRALGRYANITNFKDWSRCGYHDHYPFESDDSDYRSAIIPNRLFGAQINADGDAI